MKKKILSLLLCALLVLSLFPLSALGDVPMAEGQIGGETKEETPGETPEETPGETPEETPGETPEETPGETPEETPGETPEIPTTYTVKKYPFRFDDVILADTLTEKTSLSAEDLLPWEGQNADLYEDFIGWYYEVEAEEGEGVTKVPATTETVLNDDIAVEGVITLYGDWKYKVTFDANGGTGTMNPVVKAFDEDYPAPECGFTAPSGKVFSHWLISIDDPTDDYTEEIDPGDYAPEIYGTWYGNVTLTAIWKVKKDPVTQVKAVIDDPEVGEKADRSAKYTTVPKNAVATSGEVTWYYCDTNSNVSSNWKAMGTNATFKVDRYYMAQFSVEIDDDDPLFFDEDNLTVTVNGEELKSSLVRVVSEKELIFQCRWSIEEDDETEISHVDAKIDLPVVGKKPATKAAFLSNPKDALDDGSYSITWYVYDKTDKDWDEMDSNKFEKGKTYGVEIVIKVDDDGDYTFAEDVTGTINGFEHDDDFCDIYDDDPEEITLFCSWKAVSDDYTITGTDIWNTDNKEGPEFRSDAEFKKFESVEVDGEKLDKDNYTVKEGSTIVTLKPSYLKKLDAGYHTVTIVSSDGEASTVFEISDDSDCEHKKTKVVNGKEATCTEKGYTGDKVCTACGAVIEKGKEVAATGHKYVNGTCTNCGVKEGHETSPDTGASVTSLAVAVILAGAAATLAYKKRK